MARQLGGLVFGLLGIALATVAGQLIAGRWGIAPVVLLYLVPVLGAAIYGGLALSLAVSVLATLAYNFFFTAPVHTFAITSPADIVTVSALFAVAVVTSSLAGSLRQQRLLADAHANRNATIAGFAGRLLSCVDESEIFTVTAGELSRLFGCDAVVVVGSQVPGIAASAPVAATLSPADIASAGQAIASGNPAGRGVRATANIADWQFHPMRTGADEGAAIGLAREDGAPAVGREQGELLESLLDQAALALARARAEGDARALAALHERDRMRDALLASIGEDFKPGLNAIAAGVRSLRRAGVADKEVVASVGAEAARLDRVIDTLVDLAPADDRAPVTAGMITIDLYRRSVSRDGEDVHLTPKEYGVLAELAKHGGRILSHRSLLRTVWGPAREDQIDYLRVAIRALRQKLEVDPANPALIVNEPAVGYRLLVD
ncbi:DUF4118 domain-containing protein [Tsuneonella sp. HG094]